MRKKLIIANWKMTPDTADKAKALFAATVKAGKKMRNAKVVACPPFIWISALAGSRKSKVVLGAQDVFWEESGSYTGEISVKMLRNAGVQYVIIGHSERRRLGETDEMINKKIKRAITGNLKVIFCVGEFERDEAGNYFQFLKDEIKKGLKDIPSRFLKNLVVVYEPVWAISRVNRSGKARFNADNPEDTFQMATYIKRILVSTFGKQARRVPVLYGGSVDPRNAGDFLEKGNVDGLLVGRASWNGKSFGELLKNIS